MSDRFKELLSNGHLSETLRAVLVVGNTLLVIVVALGTYVYQDQLSQIRSGQLNNQHSLSQLSERMRHLELTIAKYEAIGSENERRLIRIESALTRQWERINKVR